MKRPQLRALAEVTIEYLALVLCVSATLLALLAASLWPPLATPPFFVIAALTGLALGLATSLVYARRALRRRYLCGGPLAAQGLWVCPMLALGRPLDGVPPPGAREVLVQGLPSAPKPAPPLRVLVVEDDPVARHIMVRNLEGAGFEVEATDDGAQALYILGHERPDVMILDLLLPTLDGSQVARVQQQLKEAFGQRTRIIVVTSNPSAQEEARHFGADAFLVKPVEGAALIRTVAELALGPVPPVGEGAS